MPRNWTQAHEKCAEEDGCRICGVYPVDPAHIVPRSRISAGLGAEDPLNIVPLCRTHHRAFDEEKLDLLPYLTRGEQAYVVQLVGLYEAYRRTTNERLVA